MAGDRAEVAKTLAAIRTEEGYMADVKRQADGTFLLVENHCPICAAAVACTGLCGQELDVFQAVLGEDVEVNRTEHIVAGAPQCIACALRDASEQRPPRDLWVLEVMSCLGIS